MGTRLGGFWARKLGHELGKPWIALNPAMQPSQSLWRYIGVNTRFDSGGVFDWSAADGEGYVAEENFTPRADLTGLLILAEDDEVLDYRVARDQAGAAEVVVLRGPSTAQYGGLWGGGRRLSRGDGGLAVTGVPEKPLLNPVKPRTSLCGVVCQV